MATSFYIDTGVTGNAAHPVFGGTDICGPDTSNGTEGDDGTIDATNPNTPLKSMSGLGFYSVQPVAGDTVYIAGRLRTDALAFLYEIDNTGGGVTYTQWPGRSTAMLRGDNLPGGTLANNLTASATYWQTATNGWKMVCDGSNGKADLRDATTSGIAVIDVVLDWDASANIDSVGRRKSHFAAAANAAAITGGTRGAQGKYFLDSATGTLYVLMPTNNGGASQANDPTSVLANGIAFTTNQKGGFAFKNSGGVTPNVGVVVNGIRFALFGDTTSTSPIGSMIYIQSGSNCLVTNCVFEDSGIHAVSFGTSMSNCVTSNNIYIGGNKSTTNAGSMHVINPAADTTTGTMRAYNELMYLNSALAHDGTLVSTAAQVIGFYSHFSGGVGHYAVLNDIEYVNCRVIGYTPPSGSQDIADPFQCSHAPGATGPADPLNPETYPVRVRQTNPSIKTISNCAYSPSGSGIQTIAYINCRLHWDTFAAAGTGYLYDRRGTGTQYHGFFGCAFVYNTQGVGYSTSAFAIANGGTLVHVDCSVFDYGSSFSGTGAIYFAAIKYTGTTDAVLSYQTIYGFGSKDNRFLCHGDSGAGFNAGAGHTFSNCTVFNCRGASAGFTDTTYSENTNYNTSAEWASVIDAANTDTLTAPFAVVTSATDLTPTTAVKSVKKRIATHVARGVNLLPYDGTRGAYQYGGSGGGLGHTGSRTGARLSRLTR